MKKFIGVYDYTVLLTYISLLFAVLGTIQAISGHYLAAVVCVVLSGICDAFDGAVARTKKNRTEDEKNYGIQLDSICDVISFGFVPALICYLMGTNGVIGIILVFFYVMCALSRLAFFNVLEIKRQQTESGSSKYYRGLPVTSVCFILPGVYALTLIVPPPASSVILHLFLAITGLLFILDFRVQKLNFDQFLTKKEAKVPVGKE